MGRMQFLYPEDKTSVYTEAVYAPEGLLTRWLSVVFTCMTSSLLFYHTTRSKMLNMDARLSALFACSLITVGMLYNISAVITYAYRMNHQIELTDDSDTKYKLNLLKYTFMSLGGITSIIQVGICVIIFKNAMYYF